jgi:DhnA family fructose-bisphosphate aldolase class Ia
VGKETEMTGKRIRFEKLFGEGRRAAMVAVDHGAEFGPTPGLMDFRATLERLSGADGILLNPGMIEAAGPFFGRRCAPLMVARVTWTTAYCFPWNYKESHTAQVMSAQDALGQGADFIMACCLLQTGSEALDRDNVRLFAKIAAQKEKAGIPLIGELYPAGADSMPEKELHERIYRGVRILAELGADAIKTFYTGERFAEVVAGCPAPVMVLGASKCEEKVALAKARKAVTAGARGVVFGRNVFQAKNPERFLKALVEVVHG